MAALTAEVIGECDRLLEPSRFADYCFNGLQVPGPEEVSRLATGVSANAELFERAAAEGADLLIVHHGLLWGDSIRAIDPLLRRRLAILFDAGIALAAYHLPLDGHPELGNNALLAGALGASETAPFALHRGEPIGCLATLPAAIPLAELVARIRSVAAGEPLLFEKGPPSVERVGIVSGAGADYAADAAAAGAQVLLTGEAEERTMAIARELGINVVAAGHHATERLGVRALGEHLAERFALTHVFLDVANPV